MLNTSEIKRGAKMKIAINGFGRIGRAAAKVILNRRDMDLAAVNDLADAATLAHLFKYDSAYGIYGESVDSTEDSLLVGRRKIRKLAEKDPAGLPWDELGIDIVLESTGVFLTAEKAEGHLRAGAKKVILSAPPKDDLIKTFVLGTNEQEYAGEDIISNASCTTNCIAPIMAVLAKKIGIEKSLMTTIHSYTADQVLVDGPHKDLRRARAAAMNIVPTTTGAAKAAGKVIPEIRGKFDGLSIRVPTPVVSLSDITALVSRDTDVEEVNSILSAAARTLQRDIIEVSNEPLVSTDLIGNPASAIVDAQLTQVVDGNLVKVIAWYDNEWGYSNRLVELAVYISKK